MTTNRVVIAEDESLIRMDLKESLTVLGYHVVGEAGDGQTAVRLARELQPDLVVMDWDMPDMNGIEAARILTDERIAPVLLLTGFSQDEVIEGAKDAGVVGFLVKPWRANDLKPAIDVALQRYREFRAIEQEATSAKGALEDRRIIERAKGVLMDTQNLKEAEAYKRMQKLSMNTRKSMREIADAILLTHEVEK